MNPEKHEQYSSYDNVRSLIEHSIADVPRDLQKNLLAVFDQRVEHGFDTDYDHMLYERIGKPDGFSVAMISKETPFGRLSCDRILACGYSRKGTIAFVGVGLGQDLQDELPDKDRFFVSTANLHERGSMRDWYVKEVRRNRGQSLELVLNDSPFSVIEGGAVHTDPVKDLSRELSSQDDDNQLPRIVLTTQRIWFFGSGRSEGERINVPMSDMVKAVDSLCGTNGNESEAVTAMRHYRQAAGKLAVAHG